MDDRTKRGWSLLWKISLIFLILTVLVGVADPILRRRWLRRSGGTTFGTTPPGFRGILEVARRLGYRAERFRRAYVSLPPATESVIVALDPQPWQRLLTGTHPSVEVTFPDRVRSWVEEGGVVIYGAPSRALGVGRGIDVVVDLEDPTAPPPDEEYPLESVGEDWKALDPFAPLLDEAPARVWLPAQGALLGRGPLEGRAWRLDLPEEEIRLSVRAYLAPDPVRRPRLAAFEAAASSPFGVLLTLDDSPIAMETKVGEGRVIAFSTSYPWTNAAVATTDIAPSLFALLDWATDGGRRSIHFDEYAHGLGVRKGALRWIWETDLLYIFTTCAIGIALLGWRGAFRNGPPREPRVLPRRAKEEFVVSLADLYARAGRPHLAARLVLRGYEDEMAAILGKEPGPSGAGAGEFPAIRKALLGRGPVDGRSLLSFTRRARAAFRRARDRFDPHRRGNR